MQMPFPPHSLQILRCRPCWQMSFPPHSLQILRCRPYSQFLAWAAWADLGTVLAFFGGGDTAFATLSLFGAGAAAIFLAFSVRASLAIPGTHTTISWHTQQSAWRAHLAGSIRTPASPRSAPGSAVALSPGVGGLKPVHSKPSDSSTILGSVVINRWSQSQLICILNVGSQSCCFNAYITLTKAGKSCPLTIWLNLTTFRLDH